MRDDRIIFGLLVMGIVPMTFGFTATFFLPAYNKDILHGGPQDLGLLMTAMGVGALGGSFLLARLGDIGGKGRLMFLSCYGWAVSLAVFALSRNLFLSMAVGALTGLCGSLVGSMNMAVTQLAVSEAVRGRVMSIMMMSQGVMPLFVLPISVIAERAGIASALLVSAVMLGVSMLVINGLFPQIRRIDKGYDDIAAAGPV